MAVDYCSNYHLINFCEFPRYRTVMLVCTNMAARRRTQVRPRLLQGVYCTRFLEITGVTEIWVSRKIGYTGVPIFPEILVSCCKFGYRRSRLLVTLVRSPSGVLTLTLTLQGLEKNRESVLRWWAKFFKVDLGNLYYTIYRRGVAIVA